MADDVLARIHAAIDARCDRAQRDTALAKSAHRSIGQRARRIEERARAHLVRVRLSWSRHGPL